MAKNYLTYPCEVMRITQNYTGTTSHLPHSTGDPKDFPWDEGGKDSGRSAFYCPCDELKVVKIYGVGSGGTNTIWVQSTSKVDFADGTKHYTCGHIIHPNDSDIKDLKVGQKFKRGQFMCYEGTDGATGNHFHLSFGKGKIKGSGWKKNSKGKWVLTTTKGAYRPEELFFVDKSFTTIMDSKGIEFKELPEGTQKYAPGVYKVTKAMLLHVRSGPGTNYSKKKYTELTTDAQKKIKKRAKYKANGYVMGMTFSVYETAGDWGRTPSGWVHLGYCKQQS